MDSMWHNIALDSSRRGKVRITKKYLQEYSRLLEEIEDDEERLQDMRKKLPGFGGMNYSGMPKGSGDKDQMSTQEAIMCDLETDLKNLRMKETWKRQEIEQSLKVCTDNPQERKVIRLKYMDRLEWSEIRQKLFGKRKDFYDREEYYKDRAFRIHNNMLKKLNPKE